MPANELETAEAQAAAAGVEQAAKRAYVKRIFSQIAPRYDFLNHLLSFNIDGRWRRRAIAELAWSRSPQGAYLDLCAGTLDVAAELAQQPGFEGQVLAADFAEPMLRAGAGKASQSIVAPIVADALELPVLDDSAAGAIVAFGIRNVADLDAGIREVHRVLEPGARFVILEFTTPRTPLFRELYRLYFHRILPWIGGVISGHRSAYSYLPMSVDSFPSEPELADRLRNSGFSDVRWQTLTFGAAAIHTATKR
jgi:demethylmenaquinone methyltransferase/2-methoxy-6-polyprenyl-1,4-benzoquinol methylase